MKEMTCDLEVIHSNDVMTVVRRVLNLIDGRLVDHGVRTMLVLRDMLEAAGCQDPVLKKNLCILAMIHDVGAYRTDEIDNLVKFEIGDVWEHSIYGYLFLREFTPLKEWAEVVLYHHAENNSSWKKPGDIWYYAQLLHTADRAVIWHDAVKKSEEELREHFKHDRRGVFSPDSVELFWRANRQYETFRKLDAPICMEEILDCSFIGRDEARAYLEMVAHVMDFRSRVTVTHTWSVMDIGVRLAGKLGLPQETQRQIYYGGLLHDLGKIGIPVSILEKPGKLNREEMAVMKNHVVLSGEIIKDCIEETVARIALRHHEKLDGSGYPLGLTAKELTLPERILAVSDIISALCMSRSYKEEFPKEKCISILKDMSQSGQLDAQVVDTAETFFDEIKAQSDEACQPIRDAYARIGVEYRERLELYRGTRTV